MDLLSRNPKYLIIVEISNIKYRRLIFDIETYISDTHWKTSLVISNIFNYTKYNLPPHVKQKTEYLFTLNNNKVSLNSYQNLTFTHGY